jgi:putative peptidoglycan lipid II flippase
LAATLVGLSLALKAAFGPGLSDKIALAILMAAGGVVYGGALVVLFGKDFMADLKRLRRGVQG